MMNAKQYHLLVFSLEPLRINIRYNVTVTNYMIVYLKITTRSTEFTVGDVGQHY